MTPNIAGENTSQPPQPAPSTAGMSRKVIKGSLWTLAGQLSPIAASFVATPFVIKYLGTEGYGVFALMSVVLTFVGFADFGMGLASTSLASEAYSKGDHVREGQVVRAAAIVAVATSGFTAIALSLGSTVLTVDLLRVPGHLQPAAITGIYLTSMALVARVLSSIFNSPQLSRMRMDLNSTINAVFNLLQIVCVPVLLFMGWGLIGALSMVLFSSVGCLLTHIIVSRKLLNRLFELNLGHDTFGPLIRSGSTIFFALAAGQALANLEKFALTRYTSVAELAYYSIAFTVANMATLFSASLTQTLIPAFSQLHSSGDLKELQDLYGRTILMNLVVYAPAALILCLFAKPFFTLWAGPEFGVKSTAPFYILLLGLMFSFSASVTGALVIAIRATGRSAIMYWLELIPYFALVILLTSMWGAVGAAATWSIRIMVESIFLVLIVRKRVDISGALGDRRLTYLLLAATPLLASALLSTTEVVSFWPALCLGTIAIAAFAIIVWRKIMHEDERAYVLRISRLTALAKG